MPPASAASMKNLIGKIEDGVIFHDSATGWCRLDEELMEMANFWDFSQTFELVWGTCASDNYCKKEGTWLAAKVCFNPLETAVRARSSGLLKK